MLTVTWQTLQRQLPNVQYFALASLLALGVSNPVFAQSEGCSDIDGSSHTNITINGFHPLASGSFSAGEVITLTASSVLAALHANDHVWAFVSLALAPTGQGAFSSLYSFSFSPVSQTVAIPTGGIAGLALLGFGLNVTLEDVEISCVSPTVEDEETIVDVVVPNVGGKVANLAGIGAFHQNQSVRNGMAKNLRGRLGAGPQATDSATQSGVFVSTQGKSRATTNTNVWMSFSRRAYFDGYEGHSADLSAGMDWLVGGSGVVGLIIGAAATDLEDPILAEAKTSSYLIGAYAAHGFPSGVQIDGYLTRSAVDYEVGATEFETTRTLAGLTLTGDITVPTGTMQPRVRVSGSWEDFPTGIGGVSGGANEQYTGAFGARHEWNTRFLSSGLTPWASLDIEYGYQEDTSGARDYYVAPRIGFGLLGAIGNGFLSTSVDIGRVRSDVYDVGLEVAYRHSF